MSTEKNLRVMVKDLALASVGMSFLVEIDKDVFFNCWNMYYEIGPMEKLLPAD